MVSRYCELEMNDGANQVESGVIFYHKITAYNVCLKIIQIQCFTITFLKNSIIEIYFLKLETYTLKRTFSGFRYICRIMEQFPLSNFRIF